MTAHEAHHPGNALRLAVLAALASRWVVAGLLAPSARSVIGEGSGIPIISIDTNHPGPVPMGPEGISPKAFNAGEGKKWNGWHSKNCMYAEFLQPYLARDPGQLAVLIDGSDMIFGGCSAEQMLKSYHIIVNASSGAPIVSGAELGLWPDSHKARTEYNKHAEARRRAVLEAAGLAEDSYSSHILCDMSSEVGGCSSPPRYKYLNGGFRMGPVKDLAELSHTLCVKHENEQLFLTQILFQRPELVTLDYTGELVMSLHHFNRSMGFLSTRGHVIHNTETGKASCFLHGNGVDGKVMKEKLAHDLLA